MLRSTRPNDFSFTPRTPVLPPRHRYRSASDHPIFHTPRRRLMSALIACTEAGDKAVWGAVSGVQPDFGLSATASSARRASIQAISICR
jgi:hypothetical protein